MQFSECVPPIIYINMPEAVLYAVTEANKDLYSAFMVSLEDLGIVSITSKHLLSAVCVVLASTKQVMPYDEINVSKAPKAQRAIINKAREDFVGDILKSIDIDLSGTITRYLFNKKDITVNLNESRLLSIGRRG